MGEQGNTRKLSTAELKDAVVASLDIRAFYEEHLNGQRLQEKSDGWSERTYCPIHNDTTTPNFFCNLRTGGFKCQSCGAAGSVFDFWIHTQGLAVEDKRNFAEAIVALASRAGVNIKSWSEHASYQSAPAAGYKNPEHPESEDFLPKRNKADEADASKTPVDSAIVETMHKALRADHYKYLASRGLTKPTIDRAMLGWDENSVGKDREKQTWFKGRYAIPVPGKDGKYRNIRLYSPRCDPQFKIVNFVFNKDKEGEKRYGSPVRLYMLDRLLANDWEHVIICEGEFDCLLLNQELEKAGFKTWGAVTGTHGANTFEPEWLEYFFGRHVYLCYDCDPPGKNAAAEHASKYFLGAIKAEKFKSVKLIDLPLPGSKDEKDISDYFLKRKFSTEEFIQLCIDTPPLIPGGLGGDEATTDVIEVPDLVSAVKDRRYIDQRVQVPLTISGTTSKIYHAIRTYRVTKCPLRDPGATGSCCSQESEKRIIPYGHELFIGSCMQKPAYVLNAISKVACQNDQKCSVTPVDKVVMEEYFAQQLVERWRAEEDADGRMRNSQELVQVSVYILQPPDNIQIEPQNYMATGWVRTHPNTSIATLFVESMIPMEEDWKKFTVERSENRELIEELKTKFTVDDLVAELTNGVTRIYEADDILYAVLLTYLSPLWIYFNGSLMRGWINAAIIGDSGTGKSATYLRLSDWLELGDLFSALSGTRTGLLYAIKQKAGEWHVSIGRYVQASCKIMAVDETQETTAEEIKRMAIAMDTGFLKVDQVASGGYHTQTRTLFLMNPKNATGQAATISDFVHGCEALRRCFDPMFIRRLDLAVFATGTHDYEFYNKKVIEKAEQKEMRLTSRMFRALIYWAWTRKPDQVIWRDEAVQACLDKAVELSKVYGHADEVPLVNPQDFRENLARLSSAYAVLDRNFTEDLQSVTIEPRHVNAMANFVDTIYSSPSCNLRQKSKVSRMKNTLDDFDKIKESFESAIRQAGRSPSERYRQSNYFCQLLLLLQQLSSVRRRDLAEQLDVTPKWVQKKMAVLQGFNLVELGRAGYKVTRKFNLFMRQWCQDPQVEQMLDGVFDEIGKEALMDDDTQEWLGVRDETDPFHKDPSVSYEDFN